MESSTDYSVIYEYQDYLQKVIYIARIYYMAAFSVVSLLGTVGNGLVIWFVVFKMKRTVNSVWFLSLALADFTFSLLQPFTVTFMALLYWPFGNFMCKLHSFAEPLNLFSSILQLTIISIDRCACVIFPVWCRNHRTTRLAWMVTLGVWVLAAGCSLPFFIFTEIYTTSDGRVLCMDTMNSDINQRRVIMRFILFFAVPLIIIVSCYAVIIVRMKRNRMITSNKPFRMIAAVITCFFIFWLPYHVGSFLEAVYPLSNNEEIMMFVVLPIAMSLAAINSCINPFLYVFFGRDFKEKFWSSIQSALRRAFTEEPDWRDPETNTARQSLNQSL